MVFSRIVTPRERIEKEIRDHFRWCNKQCCTFNPTAYRKARIDLNLSKAIVQRSKPLCHNQE